MGRSKDRASLMMSASSVSCVVTGDGKKESGEGDEIAACSLAAKPVPCLAKLLVKPPGLYMSQSNQVSVLTIDTVWRDNSVSIEDLPSKSALESERRARTHDVIIANRS